MATTSILFMMSNFVIGYGVSLSAGVGSACPAEGSSEGGGVGSACPTGDSEGGGVGSDGGGVDGVEVEVVVVGVEVEVVVGVEVEVVTGVEVEVVVEVGVEVGMEAGVGKLELPPLVRSAAS